MPRVKCNYIVSGAEVHSKIYIWNASSEAQIAFCGSLNYTINAFYKRRESVVQCDAKSALDYYNSLLADSLDCFDSGIEASLKNVVNNEENFAEIDNSEKEYLDYDSKEPIGEIKISLLTADGSRTGYGFGNHKRFWLVLYENGTAKQ